MTSSPIECGIGYLHVLLIDDHIIFRRGLRQVLLAKFPDLAIVEVGTAQEGLDALGQQKFDLVFLDLNLPDKPGIQFLKEVNGLGYTVPIIVLSVFSEKEFGIRVLQAHGASYLRKDCSNEELYRCVQVVCGGQKHVSDTLGEQLAESVAGGLDALGPYHSLSNREIEILHLFAMGNKPMEIANLLSLSVKTVSSHRTRLLEKLNLRTTAELIRYAIKSELYDNSQ
ncbi:MAG: response regulator transcription factor [Nitrospirales bacterium]|nr:response regulator transcription factor [Nitrospira sp.]MDR4501391.1 response regulator transcription factor [Nitrospirales bacterium]